MDKTGRHYTTRNKLDTEGKILHALTYMCALKNKEKKVKYTDIENKTAKQ